MQQPSGGIRPPPTRPSDIALAENRHHASPVGDQALIRSGPPDLEETQGGNRRREPKTGTQDGNRRRKHFEEAPASLFATIPASRRRPAPLPGRGTTRSDDGQPFRSRSHLGRYYRHRQGRLTSRLQKTDTTPNRLANRAGEPGWRTGLATCPPKRLPGQKRKNKSRIARGLAMGCKLRRLKMRRLKARRAARSTAPAGFAKGGFNQRGALQGGLVAQHRSPVFFPT